MRVALLTPYYLPSTRGNAITVHRIEQHLQRLGCTTAVFSLESGSAVSQLSEIIKFSPDIVHAFHAVRCGGLALQLAAEHRCPYVITLTGTDMYGAREGAGAGGSLAALRGAAALVFFAEQVRESFLSARPELKAPLVVIPQGVAVPEHYPAEPSAAPFIFFLPAGIRAVKNLLVPFPPLAELQRRYPQIRLVLAGGLIEPEYAVKLFAAVAANPFACWLGEVAFERMPELYTSAHVVLNSSLAEGGMANSLLEGMAYGRPLLASDVEGNRSLVRDSGSGFLFCDPEDFIHKAEMLLLDRGVRHRMGAAGRAYVSSHCSPVVEAERYLDLYRSCC